MTEADLNRAMDALIAEIESKHGHTIAEMIHTCPVEETQVIKRRLLGYLFMLAVDRNPSSTVEVSVAVLVSLLSEVYRWRERHGDLNATVH